MTVATLDVVFVRHGLSVSNAHGANALVPGECSEHDVYNDPQLSTIGVHRTRQNAPKIVSALGLGFDCSSVVFMSSTLTRAVETAHIIAGVLPVSQTIVMAPYLRELPSGAGVNVPRELVEQVVYLSRQGIQINDTFTRDEQHRFSQGDLGHFLEWLVHYAHSTGLSTAGRHTTVIVVTHCSTMTRFLQHHGLTRIPDNNECWKASLQFVDGQCSLGAVQHVDYEIET